MNRFIKKILLETNQFCNLNCAYCFYNDLGRSKNYLGLEDIKTICKKYYFADEFLLTGGECTLNKEFLGIIDFLSKRGKITIFTNGVDINRQSDEEINFLVSKLDKIIITYDSFSKSYNLRNSVELCVLGSIEKIVKLNPKKLEVKICLSKFNIFDFENTLKKLIKIGVTNFSVNYVKNIRNSNLDFQLSDDEVIENFNLIKKYSNYFNMCDNSFMHKSYELKFKNKVNCSAGKKFIYIDCNGNEYYCPSSTELFDVKSPKERNCFGKHCICIWELVK